MENDAIINILSWCGYSLKIYSNNCLDAQFYTTEFYSRSKRYQGLECARIDGSIISAASKVIKEDPIVATMIAICACKVYVSNYKTLIKELREKYENIQKI